MPGFVIPLSADPERGPYYSAMRRRLIASVAGGLAYAVAAYFGTRWSFQFTGPRSTSLALLVALAVGIGVYSFIVVALPVKSPPPVGRCRRCGYDLRGNVSGVCSECGKRV